MTTIDEAARDFLEQKRIAVAGVSRQPSGHGANPVFRRLRERGYEVFAVNPNADTVEGDPCFRDLRSIPGGVDAVVIATTPAVTRVRRSRMPRPRHHAHLDASRVWTGRRIAELLTGVLVALVALVFLGGGGTVFWAYFTQREGGFATTDVDQFSTSGSALATVPTDLGSSGTGWLYAPNLLGEVRIRVTPANPDAVVFVGIGPSADVDRYLAGVNHTVISDFWTETLRQEAARIHSVPSSQGFWVASSSGAGARNLKRNPDDGSWTVVVMNADGQPGIDVRADRRIRHPEVSGESGGSGSCAFVVATPCRAHRDRTLRIARRQPLAFAKVNLTLGLIPVIPPPPNWRARRSFRRMCLTMIC